MGTSGKTISLDNVAKAVGKPKDGARVNRVRFYFEAKAHEYAPAGYPYDAGGLLPSLSYDSAQISGRDTGTWSLSKRVKVITNGNELGMSVDDQSRREFVKVATAGMVAASAVSLSAVTAEAYQGNMENVLGALRHALVLLRRATPDKGGHKATAVQLIEQAIRPGSHSRPNTSAIEDPTATRAEQPFGAVLEQGIDAMSTKKSNTGVCIDVFVLLALLE